MSFTIDKAFDLLARAHEAGRLSHAYLITGSEGAGKRELAARVIRLVNQLPDSEGGLDALRSGNVAILQPESRSRVIKIGEATNPGPNTIRGAEKTLQRTAPASVTKFLVIRDCDRVNVQAENAFLKTLEEPPRGSMLLLLTAFPEQLLPTIRSRCLRIPLRENSGPLPVADSARELLDALRDNADAGAAGVSGALGLMGRFSAVLKAEKDGITARNEAAYKAEVEHYQKTTEGDWLKRREEFYKALSQSEYLEVRTRLIEYLVAWFGDALRQQCGGGNLDLPDYTNATSTMAKSLTGRELGRKIDAVEALRSHLNTNVQEGLALEAAFLQAFS